MAQKRMLHKTISVSPQVNSLSVKHKLIFTWAIPHLDDWGFITNNPIVFKAMVFPLAKEVTIKDISIFIEEAERAGLVLEYQDCIEFTGFNSHQKISSEKRAKCKFQRIPKNPQESPGSPEKPLNRLEEIRLEEISKDMSGNQETLFSLFQEKIYPRAKLTNLAKQMITSALKKFSQEDLEKIINFKSQDAWFIANNGPRGASWFFQNIARLTRYLEQVGEELPEQKFHWEKTKDAKGREVMKKVFDNK